MKFRTFFAKKLEKALAKQENYCYNLFRVTA